MGQSRPYHRHLFPFVLALTLTRRVPMDSVSVYGGHGKTVQLCVLRGSPQNAYPRSQSLIWLTCSRPVNANELERLKKRFMKLDACVRVSSVPPTPCISLYAFTHGPTIHTQIRRLCHSTPTNAVTVPDRSTATSSCRFRRSQTTRSHRE